MSKKHMWKQEPTKDPSWAVMNDEDAKKLERNETKLSLSPRNRNKPVPIQVQSWAVTNDRDRKNCRDWDNALICLHKIRKHLCYLSKTSISAGLAVSLLPFGSDCPDPAGVVPAKCLIPLLPEDFGRFPSFHWGHVTPSLRWLMAYIIASPGVIRRTWKWWTKWLLHWRHSLSLSPSSSLFLCLFVFSPFVDCTPLISWIKPQLLNTTNCRGTTVPGNQIRDFVA